MSQAPHSIPSVSVSYAGDGRSTRANELGMRPMQERAYQRRGEQYLLLKSPPASGKSRALMFIALDKLENQGLKQAIIVVPEKSIGASFNDEPLSQFGFWADWKVEPRWNLCNAPGEDGGKVESVKTFLESGDRVLVCTHATFRFAVDRFGIEAFDDRLIAVDEFHHVSANPDNRLGEHVRQFVGRDKAHLVAMTGSYFRGDAEAVLHPDDEARFETVTYTYYEQLSGYQHLKQLDIGYYFYSGSYADEILNVLSPDEKTILHIPNVNSRESTKDKIREVEHIIEALGEWQGKDAATGFDLVRRPDGRVLKIADLVDDGPDRHSKVLTALQKDLETGQRTTLKFQENADVNEGEMFILDGQKVFVARLGDKFVNDYGRPDRRLRLIYDNGTESDLLLRSFQRALYKDKASRRITTPDLGPLFAGHEEDDDSPSGFIYILRSHSKNPFIQQNREVIHKIGVTGGDIKRRVANARKDPTFLMADVEIIETYKLANVERSGVERLLHRFFAAARLDLHLKDRFGDGIEPKEWFLVPLPVIREAIGKLLDGTIQEYRYDPANARIVKDTRCES